MNPCNAWALRSWRVSDRSWVMGLMLVAVTVWLGSAEAANRLLSMDYALLPGDRLEFKLSLDGQARLPRDFQTENPSRIVLDLPGVSNGLNQKTIRIQRAGVKDVQVVEASGRTRLVFNLESSQPYRINSEGNRVVLTLQGDGDRRARTSGASPFYERNPSYDRPVVDRPVAAGRYVADRDIGNVDFRRGEAGEGQLLISLADARSIADIRREGSKVVVSIRDAVLPSRLARRLDVIDFATPVHYIEALPESGGARIVVTPVNDRYEFSSYQSGNLLAVEFRPMAEKQRELADRNKPVTYSGNKLTLNFQDIAVRSVLQILADFTNVNIVASDAVNGNVTLRLQDVPWDQALDLVLKAKGLGKRQEGNIIRVAPQVELDKDEIQALEKNQEVEMLEPIRSQIFQINYTKAEEIKKILIGIATRTEVGKNEMVKADDVNQSLVSDRGSISTDSRTNQLIVNETARNLERIGQLIVQLDKPVRQVLIESRIVIATNDFTRELGARLSLNRAASVNRQSLENTDYAIEPPADQNGVSGKALVDLASTAASASGGYFGVTFLKVGEYLLDLELSAAQIDGRTEIISTPKVVTTDGVQAYMLQGEQIPYSQNNALGASNTQFKDAVLELKVTPHITANDNILMDLSVKKDAPGKRTYAGGNVGIEKREIVTSAQVSNGETMVLGGVFEGDKVDRTDKVPFLGDLPGVGFMFRKNLVQDNKKELLIFITPKIIGSELVRR